MDQKFEGTPHAEIRLDGRKVVRSEVAGDWGLRLQWKVSHNGKVVATPPARADLSYEHPDTKPGKYEIVLEMWKYVSYRKDAKREFVDSKFVEVSNKVAYTI
jgi:hypothetical protein